MQQQNALLQEIKQDQTNLAKIKTVNSMGDELKVSFGPYEGSKNGWNAYLSLYSDGILVYTDTVIVSYETVAGKKAPNMETELNDAVIEEYTNNVDMYNSLLTRGDPILYFVLEYSVNAKSEDNPSEYDFIYKNLKVYNTLSDKVVQNIAINKTEAKVMNPKQDLKIYDGIVEKEKNVCLAVKDYITSQNEKIDTVVFDVIVEVCELAKRAHLEINTSLNLYTALNALKVVEFSDININMLQTEVTQELYEIVMGENPSYFQGSKKLPAEGENQSKRPVENVSWYDAIYFCNKFSVILGLDPAYSVDGETDVTKWDYKPHHQESLDGRIIKQNLYANGFRLPTVEEWKYAAKGGEGFNYSGSNNIDEVAWYYGNSDDETHEVGKKKANGYGLFDMSGNVYEWCWDSSSSGSYRYYCGGSWGGSGIYSKVDSEDCTVPEKQFAYIGFRIVCSQE